MKFNSHGINWEGLKKLVSASDMSYKDEVLEILHTMPKQVLCNSGIEDECKQQLKTQHGGQPYKYMYRHFFPELRSANVNIYCEFERLPKLERPIAIANHPAPKVETLPMSLESTHSSSVSTTQAFLYGSENQYALRCTSYSQHRYGIAHRARMVCRLQLDVLMVEKRHAP